MVHLLSFIFLIRPNIFLYSRQLESHILIHIDQKPFQCDACDQSFRQKQLLKRHQNLYHNPNYVPPQPKEKTHECPECQRTFRLKGNLIQHMVLHDSESTEQEKAMALKIGGQKVLNHQYATIITNAALSIIRTKMNECFVFPFDSVLAFFVKNSCLLDTI